MDQQVIDFLNSLDDASEGMKVSWFKFYFDNREVTVRVFDRGTGAGQIRFTVEAYLSDLEQVPIWERGDGFSSGNAEPTLELALHAVHWRAIASYARTSE